jgi:hypothetical protein
VNWHVSTERWSVAGKTFSSWHLKPAWFADNEAQDDVDRLSKNFGPPTHVFPMPPQSSVPNGMIVTWGKVALEQLDQDNVSQLAAGHKVRAGLMIDHIGNSQRSAQLGLPIYRLTGGAGYIWAASWNQGGTGTLRYLAVDASKLIPSETISSQATIPSDPPSAGAFLNAAPAATTNPPATSQSTPKTADSPPVVVAQPSQPEGSKPAFMSKPLVAQQTVPTTAPVVPAKQALVASTDNAADPHSPGPPIDPQSRSRVVGPPIAIQPTVMTFETNYFQTALSVAVVILIGAVGFLLFDRWKTNQARNPVVAPDERSSIEHSAVKATSKGKTCTETAATNHVSAPSLDTAQPMIRKSPAEPASSENATRNAPSGGRLRYGFVVILAVCAVVALDYAPYLLRASHLASGVQLKVWVQEVYLDPKATGPIMVLNIQNRDESPVTLTGVSVNDDPKCFPEYRGKFSLKQTAETPEQTVGMMNGFLKIMMQSKGINVLSEGYSKTLKLGEIEKLSLGSPQLGGCTPAKAVITTDRGSSSFTFE